jgi:hypothetical protein
MKRTAVWTLAAVLATSAATGGQLQPPSDWKWRTDVPAKLGAGDVVAPDAWHFVAMPPGWHVTTGPGALLYPAVGGLRGNFRLEAEIFLFPGKTQDEYGLFIGGAGLEPASASPSYVAFVARRDGQAAILKRTSAGLVPVVAWTVNDAVLPHPGGTSGTAKNVFRVEAGAAEIAFSANGREIAKIPRAGVDAEGLFGFRVGKDVNLHIATLDVTQRLAPVPVKR